MIIAENYTRDATLEKLGKEELKLPTFGTTSMEGFDKQPLFHTLPKGVILHSLSNSTTVLYSIMGKSPWFANIANYLASRYIPPHFNYQDKKKFFHDLKNFIWDDFYLFKICGDNIIRRCVPEWEVNDILFHCHDSKVGGHFGVKRTASKVLECGFYWPTLFKDANGC